MKFQETERRITSMDNVGKCLGIVSVFALLFFLCSASGCATGNAGGETSKELVGEGLDFSSKSESSGENNSEVQTVKAEKEEVLLQEKQQIKTKKQTPAVKPPIQLKPLLTVMPAKAQHKKGEKTKGPKVHIELAFDNADIHEVLDVTLYELFRVNYMVDPSIKAKVTFHIAGDYTKNQFINKTPFLK